MSNSAYKEFQWNSDQPAIYHHALLKSILRLLPKDCGCILDIGCGNGYIANQLIDAGYEVYGIDASAQGIEQANKRHVGHFHVNDLTTGKLPEALSKMKFTTILSTEVIEHLYSPQQYIDFIKSILASNNGKYLIISTPYHGYVKNIAVALANRFDYNVGALWEGGHIKFWSRKSLTRLLTKNGFSNVAFEGSGHLPLLWRQMVLRSQI